MEVFFLLRGVVVVENDGEEMAVLKQGAFFGESIYVKETREADVIAADYCQVIHDT